MEVLTDDERASLNCQWPPKFSLFTKLLRLHEKANATLERVRALADDARKTKTMVPASELYETLAGRHKASKEQDFCSFGWTCRDMNCAQHHAAALSSQPGAPCDTCEDAGLLCPCHPERDFAAANTALAEQQAISARWAERCGECLTKLESANARIEELESALATNTRQSNEEFEQEETRADATYADLCAEWRTDALAAEANTRALKSERDQLAQKLEAAERDLKEALRRANDNHGMVRLLEGENDQLAAQVTELESSASVLYTERNTLVAFLARQFTSGLRKTEIEGWDPEWHGCVFIDSPEGQLSWHYHDSDAHLFAGLPPYEKPWDGHTTAEKYTRLMLLGAVCTPEQRKVLTERDQLVARVAELENTATIIADWQKVTPEERQVLADAERLPHEFLDWMRTHGSIPISNLAVSELANRAVKAKAIK